MPENSIVSAPSVTLPKGGGAIRGIGEKVAANPATGTAAASIPIQASTGRSGVGPTFTLTYDSGAGNSPFGFGWSIGLPQISRRTDRGLPQYTDDDVFVLSGAEDLVPVLSPAGLPVDDTTTVPGYTVRRYRPRIEGLFARIERWRRDSDGDTHWRVYSSGNGLTVLGGDERSRIADPADPNRVFTWLISETRDDKGNAAVYDYKAGDAAGADLTAAHQRNRGDATDPRRRTNRYLKRVRYGNRVPLLDPDGRRPTWLSAARIASAGWLFELVFDYGEHDPAVPTPAEVRPWGHRADPWSTYRAGFEVRTERLCRRVLTFHHFPDEPGVGVDCLVRSTDLAYSDVDSPADPRNAVYTFLRAATQVGYVRAGAGYRSRRLPRSEFEYAEAVLHDVVEEVDESALANLPAGLDRIRYQWVDLHGDGIGGVLTEQAGTWLYQRNLTPAGDSAVALAPVEVVATRPNLVLSDVPTPRLVDLAGDGRPDLVVLDGSRSGFFAHDDAEGWEPYRSFARNPFDVLDRPGAILLDLDGDGLVDLLVDEDDAFLWSPSLGHDGFGAPRRGGKPADDEAGPRLVFADGAQSIHIADMSGDGLPDLVRVRNGGVCYWPNLGYGRFGAKVTMDAAPVFDEPDQFDERRVRLADVDGTGPTDLIYLHRDGVRVWFNQSGNGWGAANRLSLFPQAEETVAITTVDLLGNGTSCLVWSSALPGDARRRMRYVRLMGSVKPHLLTGWDNNLGARTRFRYAPSTRFFLLDAAAGRPWPTRLPFPVQVVERVETVDAISGNRFVTRYAYHDGYFDPTEREFRGFGLVEQWDTEEYASIAAGGALPATNEDQVSHVPPRLTRSWFHTGSPAIVAAPVGAGSPTGPMAPTDLPSGLSVVEEREAVRALKGSLLRQEVYGLDGSARADVPYQVTEHRMGVRCLQRQGANPHAVFLPYPAEALSHHLERDWSDPRTEHTAALEVDDYGNVVRSVTLAYGRRTADPALPPADRDRQRTILATVTWHRFTNAVLTDPGGLRVPLPFEAATDELTGLALAPGRARFTVDELRVAESAATPIDALATPAPGIRQLRPVGRTRTVYRRDDLSGPLPPGTVELMGAAFESYRLVLTPSLLAAAYGGRVTAAMLAEGGYVRLAGDPGWWAPSGRTFHSADPTDSPAQELAVARAHFFQARRYRDPFHTAAAGTETTVVFDPYDLLVTAAEDAAGNRISAELDYRVLAPRVVTDANGNRGAVAFDALGMVVGTAAMGKAAGPVEGDSFVGFDADLTEAVIQADLADPLAAPAALLGPATTRTVYDVLAYERTRATAHPRPAAVHTMMRETHSSEPVPAGGPRIQHQVSYSDGYGREVQRKAPAEPGPVPVRDGAGRIVTGPDGRPVLSPAPAPVRWVGSGWTVYDNKGNPVRRFEPFFSDTHLLDADARIGISPITFRDPLGRVVGELSPDHAWGRTTLTPWRVEAWDANDTVLIGDPAADSDLGGWFTRLPLADYRPTWYEARIGGALGSREQAAAEATAVHAGTPTVTHADPLGRTIRTVAHNRSGPRLAGAGPVTEEVLAGRVELDITGQQRSVVDELDRVVMRYDRDLAGTVVRQAGMESGERLTLTDVRGNPIYAWNSRGHRMRSTYDRLRRPVGQYLRVGEGAELLVGLTAYGEGAAAAATNRRGRVVEVRDQAGVVGTTGYDFKGNAVGTLRRLAQDYTGVRDWNGPVPLTDDTFTAGTRFDALGRAVELRHPDGSVVRPTFNVAGLLESLEADLGGGWTPFVTAVDYDAHGRRTTVEYGNGARTRTTFDPVTQRMAALVTTRDPARFPADCPTPPAPGWPGCQVQQLHYTYDPVGNVTHIRDDAQQTLFFRNRRVAPDSAFTYDALYRLTEATGREHVGQAGAPLPPSYRDSGRIGLTDAPTDGAAMGRYLELFDYDRAGNLSGLAHRGTDPANPGWTRAYRYQEASALEPARVSNRLTSSTVSGVTESYSVGGDGYDPHGNLLRMPQLSTMEWNFRDQLAMTGRQAVNATDAEGTERAGERTFHVYDSSGQRIRTVTRSAAGAVREECIRLGVFEVYRRFGSAPSTRETLHIVDGGHPVALVETRTSGGGGPDRLIRYQFGNHLGSASLELDGAGQVLSYEEYTPFGATAYQAVRGGVENPKRFRYAGAERDEESGLYHQGMRYYAPWLGRWISADPAGLVDGANLYAYCGNRPVTHTDPTGTQGTTQSESSVLAEVDKTLEAAGIKYNTEVTVRVELPDKTIVVRRFDRFYYDPNTKGWVGIEGKGARPSSLTDAQRLADRALQDHGGRFEIVDPVGTPPGGQPKAGLALQRGQVGTFEPGAIHHAHGKPGHVGAAGEPYAMDVATWRQGITGAHGGAGRPPGTAGYAKKDGTFEWVSQPEAKAVAGQPDKNMLKSAAPKADLAPATKSAAPAMKATPTEVGGVPTGTAVAAEAKQNLPPEGALNGGVVPPAAIRAGVRALPKAVQYAGEALTIAGAMVEAEKTDVLLQQHRAGDFDRATNATAMMIIGVVGGVVDDALAGVETGMAGAPNVVMQSWTDNGSGPVQNALGEGYRAILKWGYRIGY
jgi:RHS repeat-associated protein